ncbi:MAG TPA: hypothetical protein VKU84_00255, partial [Stellaceae bacterium]|nr:hypothetical protein [Stellaceae bacterium]
LTQASIARHYDDLLDGIMIDKADRAEAETLPLATVATGTLMRTLTDRERLARAVLDFGTSIDRRAEVTRVR